MKLTIKIQFNKQINDVSLEPNSTITIGRTDKSNVTVPDPSLSGLHCKIIYQPPVLQVTDMGSKNGTYINSIKVDQSDLYVGDEINIGDTKVSISIEKSDPKTISALTFPGQAKDRVAQSIQLDYARSGMVPQGYVGLPGTEKKTPGVPGSQLEQSRPTQTKNKLTKKAIKLRNKRETSQAKNFDIIFFIAALALPLVVSNLLLIFSPDLLKKNRLIIMLVAEILSGGLFYVLNYKVLKFTFGEKVAGIQKLYESQGS